MPYRTFIGSDEITNYVESVDAAPAGPGVVGSGTIYLSRESGGLDLRFGEEVKCYRTNTGVAGVAPRGRILFGIVSNRTTSHITNIKTWEIPVQGYNVLLKKIVRDAHKPLVISAGNFDTQVAQIIEFVQENDGGSVAKPIATNGVANLQSSMAAYTFEAGHSLGWYLAAQAHRVREINPAVYPAFYIGTEVTFGDLEPAGGANLHFYDASLFPSPVYEYHTDPTGAQRQIWGVPTRTLDGAGVVNRRQLLFGDGLIATHAETASGLTYPNDWINHGILPSTGILVSNAGYWMDEPLTDGDISGWNNVQNAIRAEVEKTAYPRETVEFVVEEQLLPGDVITVINDLEGINQNMRVVEAKSLWQEDAVAPWTQIRCGARLLRLGEDSEEIPVPPTEGDVTPPSVPTWAASEAWVLQNLQEPGNYAGVTFEAQLTLAEPGDMSHYLWRYYLGTNPPEYTGNGRDGWITVRTEATEKELLIENLPFSTQLTIHAQAFDSSNNGSAWSAAETANTVDQRFWDSPPNMHFEQAVDDDTTGGGDMPDASTRPWGWTPTENGTSTARLYAADRMDGASCARFVSDGSNTPTLMGGLFPISDDTSQTYYWGGFVKGSHAAEVLTLRVYWYDEDGVTVGNVAAGSPVLTTSWAQFEFAVASPGLGARWASLHIGFGSVTASRWAQIDAMVFIRQAVGGEIQDGAITDDKLGTITDVTHYELDVATNPFKLLSGATERVYMVAAGIGAGTEAGIRISALTAHGGFALGLRGPGSGADIALVSTGIETNGDLKHTGDVHITSAGTAFPGSPASGDAFYRSDLRRWGYYDGTRWLGEPERIHYHPRSATLATDKVTLTANSHIWYATLPFTGTWYIDKIAWWVQVLTTNSGSHYWVLRLAKYSAAYGGSIVLDVNTSALSPDQRRPVTGTVNTTFDATAGNDFSLFIEGQKSGSPGNLEVFGVTLTIREVLT